ncbi:nuclear transport factor 2 family protein [Actinocrinis puniceicyclus]|uniref:Nuclear transport factor 2 family protein n=1 Tax=Actinocrinis puniceicyclus TaxID=977794 RepID=A0A8J8BFW0_9ACTN|nr:nuclear transport factor 2 family protein [Actinocrinis puniceicyclus]MBS2966546.1 nuclear transport factor 2 family protein [Actinocrinis puniceicyclus]
MSQEIDLVARFFSASENSQIEAALDCFAEGGVWIDPTGKVYAGAEIEPYLKQQIDLLHEFHSKGISVNYTPLTQEGDRVYIGATVNEADGTEIRRFVDVFVMRDGKIAIKDVFAK